MCVHIIYICIYKYLCCKPHPKPWSSSLDLRNPYVEEPTKPEFLIEALPCKPLQIRASPFRLLSKPVGIIRVPIEPFVPLPPYYVNRPRKVDFVEASVLAVLERPGQRRDFAVEACLLGREILGISQGYWIGLCSSCGDSVSTHSTLTRVLWKYIVTIGTIGGCCLSDLYMICKQQDSFLQGLGLKGACLRAPHCGSGTFQIC